MWRYNSVWMDIKYSFTLLTGMKKLFWLQTFFDPWYLKKNIKKWPKLKIFLHLKISFIMPFNHAKKCFKNVSYFHTFSLASNCSLPATIENRFPKLDPGTLEDMLFTNLGMATWFLKYEIALILMPKKMKSGWWNTIYTMLHNYLSCLITMQHVY